MVVLNLIIKLFLGQGFPLHKAVWIQLQLHFRYLKRLTSTRSLVVLPTLAISSVTWHVVCCRPVAKHGVLPPSPQRARHRRRVEATARATWREDSSASCGSDARAAWWNPDLGKFSAWNQLGRINFRKTKEREAKISAVILGFLQKRKGNHNNNNGNRSVTRSVTGRFLPDMGIVVYRPSLGRFQCSLHLMVKLTGKKSCEVGMWK